MSTEIAFVCVQNAGRSQMATAFAERAHAEHDAEAEIEIPMARASMLYGRSETISSAASTRCSRNCWQPNN